MRISYKAKMSFLLGAMLVTFSTLGLRHYNDVHKLNKREELIADARLFKQSSYNSDRWNVMEFTRYLDELARSNDSNVSDTSLDSDMESSDSLQYLGSFKLTGYCDCEICQGPWVGTTALGMEPTVNNTIAVDPNIIPLGSYVWINGVRYHAEDTGSAINENRIDIFCSSHEECYSDFCNGWADVYLEK